MRPGGGRRKGAGFENDVAKLIRAVAVKYGFSEDCCYRTPLSGGHRFASKQDPGDLVVVPDLRKYFPFSVECKNQQVLDMEHFMRPWAEWQKSWAETQWLEQACAAAGKLKLAPMLVFKKNKTPIYAALPLQAWNAYAGSYRTTIPSCVFDRAGVLWVLTGFHNVLQIFERALNAKDVKRRKPRVA